MAKKRETSKKSSSKKTAIKKSKNRKSSKKKTFNYTGAAAGLFAVCIILIAVFLFIKPAVEQDKIRNFSSREYSGVINNQSVPQEEIQKTSSINQNKEHKDNIKKDSAEIVNKPSKTETSEKAVKPLKSAPVVQSESSKKPLKSELSEKKEKKNKQFREREFSNAA